MSKTLREIIEAVKDGEKPEYDDLLYGLLVLSHLHAFDCQDMLKLYSEADKAKMFILKFLANESFNRSKNAMSVTPKAYLGDSWNPANPEYQKQRKVFKKIADKIIGDKDEQS